MTVEELDTFLRAANQATYANAEAPKSASLRPGSEDYHFELGNLSFHDTYFGGRDFMGEEVIYENGVPVWGMNYYGRVLGEDVASEEVYRTLRPALLQDTGSLLPVRGPAEYSDGDNSYTNAQEGTLESFSGEEKVFVRGKLAYSCVYHGGAIT